MALKKMCCSNMHQNKSGAHQTNLLHLINMKKYLFFDTETTGLPKSRHAPVHQVNNWPRMVQIAWLLFDSSGNEIGGSCHIIKPNGFTIPADVSRIHRITNDRAIKEGVNLITVLESFSNFIDKANVLVAHNMAFDEKIVGAEFIRNRMPNSVSKKKTLCTMLASTNYCRLPGPYGYKWPKLSELHTKLFGYDFEEAHDALADIRATAKCFWKMREIKLI